MDDFKDTNPKFAAGEKKIPLHLNPPTASAYMAVGLFEGMLKYGRTNWLAGGVSAATYKSALERHMNKWFSGEDCDPVTTVPHLANAIACLAILIDATEHGVLIDDRYYGEEFPSTAAKLESTVMPRLRELFAHNNPPHYSRLAHDNPANESL